MKKLVLITEVQGHKFETEVKDVNLDLKQIKQFVNLMGCKFKLKLK